MSAKRRSPAEISVWYATAMSVIRLQTSIEAPRAVVFDASRSIRLHVASMTDYGEEVVSASAEDLLGPGDEVTWRARHFGVTLELTVRITEFDRPRHFRDSMVRGPFAWMHHDHYFEEAGRITKMSDVFAYGLPLGLLGRAADLLAVRARLSGLLHGRVGAIKEAAEHGW